MMKINKKILVLLSCITLTSYASEYKELTQEDLIEQIDKAHISLELLTAGMSNEQRFECVMKTPGAIRKLIIYGSMVKSLQDVYLLWTFYEDKPIPCGVTLDNIHGVFSYEEESKH